jgi:hypothetical protein
MRRWSRATLGLAQQEGAIDALSMRRLLADHFEQCADPKAIANLADWRGSWIVSLAADRPPLVWVAPGSVGMPLYFPLVVGMPLPQTILEGPVAPVTGPAAGRGSDLLALCDRLQGQFDQEIETQMRGPVTTDNYLEAGQDWMNRHADLWVSTFRGLEPASSRSSSDDLAFISE